MKEKQKEIRKRLYLGLMILYLAWSLTGSTFLQYLFGFILLAAAFLAWPLCKPSTRIIGLALFVVGGFNMFRAGVPWQGWAQAFSSNGGLVVLFLSVPLLSVLLAYQDFVGLVTRLFQKYIKESHWYFGFAAILSGLVGAVMALGGIALLYDLLHPNMIRYGGEVEEAQSLTRGNLSMSYWAPCHMSVATVITYTGITWLELAPRGLLLSAIQLGVIFLFFYVSKKRGKMGLPLLNEEAGEKVNEDPKQERRIMAQLLLIYVGLIALVGLMTALTDLPILAIITLVSIGFPWLVGKLLDKMDVFRGHAAFYLQKKLPAVLDQVVLFSSVGFFGKSIEVSGYGDLLVRSLNIQQWASPSLVVGAVALVMVALSMMGIHPIVSIIALATTLNPDLMNVTSRMLAYTYLLGYGVGVIVSPLSGAALAMSGLNGKDPWNGMSKHNLFYGMFLIVLFSLLIPLIG